MTDRLKRAAPSALIAGIAAAVIYALIEALAIHSMSAGQIILWAVVWGIGTFVVAALISVIIASTVTRSK